MESDEIRGAVHAVIESVAPGADAQRIRPDQPLRKQVDLDSMDWLNVIEGIQEKLSIEIPESGYGRLETLDSIVACLASRQLGFTQVRDPEAPGTVRVARTLQR